MAAESSPLRLTRLRIKNFRSIGDVDVPLGPLTVLVGPNGSGKSNMVDALRFMRDCLTRGLDQAILDREGLEVLRQWKPSGRPAAISLGVTCAGGAGYSACYDFTLSADSTNGFRVKREELRLAQPHDPSLRVVREQDALAVYLGRELVSEVPSERTETTHLFGPQRLAFVSRIRSQIAEPPMERSWRDYDPLVSALRDSLMAALFYTLNPAGLRAPQRLVREAPLDEAGQNLAAVLRQLRKQEGTAAEIRQLLARLVPGITDFSVEPAGSYLVGYLHYQTASGKTRLADLGRESDGTLRALAVLAALHHPDARSGGRRAGVGASQPLLCLEEPEVNIHPGMLAVLAELFQEASHREQLLLTTHSPDLLDFLPADSFLVVEKVDGETRVGPLATDQAEIVRRKLFTAGELLRTEGLHRQEAPAEPLADSGAV